MRFVLLGDPVEHSRSPVIMNAALAAAGIPGTYGIRRVGRAGLDEAFTELQAGRLDGANVTMPHKQAAATRCDRLLPEAERAGAVNTVIVEAGAVVGHNTDVAGVRAAWRHGGLPVGPVLLLGAGGAAAAALLALEGMPIAVAARRPEAASALVRRTGVAAETVPWGTVLAGAVVVNATPVGMRGEALPGGVVAAAAGLFDMTYGAHAPSVAAARAAGLTVVDGHDMLLHQAAAAFVVFTGVEAPLRAMETALSAHLS